jgi:hypothetical protein
MRIRLSSLDCGIMSSVTVSCVWLPPFQRNVMLPTSGQKSGLLHITSHKDSNTRLSTM